MLFLCVLFVDVMDVGQSPVDAAARGRGGAYNVTRPGLAWSELLETCREVAGSDATFRWVPDALLTGHDVGEWMELPLWVADPAMAGIHEAVVTRAVEAGLTFRPLAETVRDTLDEAGMVESVGLTPEREAQLLAAS